MEIKLPPELDKAIDVEIAVSSKPWKSRREWVLDAISDKIAHDQGYRKRAENRRKQGQADAVSI